MRPLQKKQKKQKNKQKKNNNKQKKGGWIVLFIDFYISLQRSCVNLRFSKFSKKKKREDILSVSTFLYKFTTQS